MPVIRYKPKSGKWVAFCLAHRETVRIGEFDSYGEATVALENYIKRIPPQNNFIRPKVGDMVRIDANHEFTYTRWGRVVQVYRNWALVACKHYRIGVHLADITSSHIKPRGKAAVASGL